MIPVDVAGVFFLATVLLALAPGPDNIFVLTQSAQHGRMAGLFVTFGLCTGLIVHTTAVAIGIAAVFQTSALAFTLLKFAGAGYLMYLAWLSFKAGNSEISNKQSAKVKMSQLYRRGVIMNVTNPKVTIFFLAFLPQFVDPTRGPVAVQIFLLGAIFVVAAILVFSFIAWGAGFLGEWLRNSGNAQTIINKVAGVVFLGMAVKLLTAER